MKSLKRFFNHHFNSASRKSSLNKAFNKLVGFFNPPILLESEQLGHWHLEESFQTRVDAQKRKRTFRAYFYDRDFNNRGEFSLAINLVPSSLPELNWSIHKENHTYQWEFTIPFIIGVSFFRIKEGHKEDYEDTEAKRYGINCLNESPWYDSSISFRWNKRYYHTTPYEIVFGKPECKTLTEFKSADELRKVRRSLVIDDHYETAKENLEISERGVVWVYHRFGKVRIFPRFEIRYIGANPPKVFGKGENGWDIDDDILDSLSVHVSKSSGDFDKDADIAANKYLEYVCDMRRLRGYDKKATSK